MIGSIHQEHVAKGWFFEMSVGCGNMLAYGRMCPARAGANSQTIPAQYGFFRRFDAGQLSATTEALTAGALVQSSSIGKEVPKCRKAFHETILQG